MKKFVVYNDIHIGAPHTTGHTLKDFLKDKENPDVIVILNGDISDPINTKKKKLPGVLEDLEKTIKAFGKNYVLGNHEGRKPELYYRKIGNVLFFHGHTIFWKWKTVLKWEIKKLGRGVIFYFFYRLRHIVGRSGGELKLKDKYLKMIQEILVERGCDTAVFGHTHKYYDKIHNGLRIVNFGQGRHEFEA